VIHQITVNNDGKSSLLNMIECFNEIQNGDFEKTLNDQSFLKLSNDC